MQATRTSFAKHSTAPADTERSRRARQNRPTDLGVKPGAGLATADLG